MTYKDLLAATQEKKESLWEKYPDMDEWDDEIKWRFGWDRLVRGFIEVVEANFNEWYEDADDMHKQELYDIFTAAYDSDPYLCEYLPEEVRLFEFDDLDGGCPWFTNT